MRKSKYNSFDELPLMLTVEDVSHMLVLGVNKILKWCQITTGGRRYTCPVKEINGVLCFAFKKAWHPVAEFISDHAEELVREGGRVFSRPFTK